MSKLNILWLSHFVPFPPKGGCFQRSYNLLKEISAKNDVYLVALKHKDSTHPDFEIRSAQMELEKFCRKVNIIDISSSTSGLSLYAIAIKSLFKHNPLSVEMFKFTEMSHVIKKLTNEIDFQIVHYDTISLAEYFKDAEGIPKILNHHGAESFMIHRRIANEPNYLKKLFFLMEARKLRRYEKDNCPKFDLNIVVSEFDKEILEEISPGLKIEIVENGVDINYFLPSERKNNNKRLIFAGRLDQYSNKDAILYFCNKVWPLIKEKIPDTRLTIIGNNPPQKLVEIANHDRGIELLGYVDDVRPFFANAMISICPIRDGGGIRIKILDALAMGMPIISTSIGCEGIEITPGKDVLIADTPQEFIESIDKIFSDNDTLINLSINARKTAENKYSWNAISRKLDHFYSLYI